ncbi:MAG: hypothetical protein JXB39_10005, partial [Deltaproteobacteria bacterium]|nr:hypothetical protein [Deltaproteobacteria bacterium]
MFPPFRHRSAFPALGFFLAFLALASCGTHTEGTEPGDCSDGADNDGDGLFDCDDDGCAGSPDCEESDTDTDSDT